MNRRGLLGGMAGLGSSAFAPATLRAEARRTVKITLPTPGSAGSIWRAAIAGLDPRLIGNIDLQWVTGDPGQMQVQLAAGALDVGLFGSVGLGTIAQRGSDIALFGPGLNNHGRMIVRADSPFQKPADLVGKRIATQPKTTETYQQARVALSLIGIDLEHDFEVIFGPPTANLALFNRGDVDAIIILEPTATRAIGEGVCELARIGDIWMQATGEKTEPFLVGLAAQRTWLGNNRQLASDVARIFAVANAALRRDPQFFVAHASDMGLRPTEAAAIKLLPSRLADVYATNWDRGVWAVIDKQVATAVKLGLLKDTPAKPLYDGVPLETAG